LNQLLKSFEKYRNAQKNFLENRSTHKNDKHASAKKHESAIKRILNFIASLFGIKTSKKDSQSENKTQAQIKPLSKFTVDILSEMKGNNAPLIPLSNYIELNRENEKQLDSLIDEIRQHNLKIVIPIYTARKVLYPIKSSEYIIPDIEYLLADINVTTSADSIRDFTDSIVGYKIKDETIPGRAIVVIENYLLTLHRQKHKRLKKG
ncbi:MAG: hypothetical protein FWG92_04610, partial [Leptospirales bacterium]|nr:hypothetical protein [Leptospirales bacterium]